MAEDGAQLAWKLHHVGRVAFLLDEVGGSSERAHRCSSAELEAKGGADDVDERRSDRRRKQPP
jgi:hypothetical protein